MSSRKRKADAARAREQCAPANDNFAAEDDSSQAADLILAQVDATAVHVAQQLSSAATATSSARLSFQDGAFSRQSKRIRSESDEENMDENSFEEEDEDGYDDEDDEDDDDDANSAEVGQAADEESVPQEYSEDGYDVEHWLVKLEHPNLQNLLERSSTMSVVGLEEGEVVIVRIGDLLFRCEMCFTPGTAQLYEILPSSTRPPSGYSPPQEGSYSSSSTPTYVSAPNRLLEEELAHQTGHDGSLSAPRMPHPSLFTNLGTTTSSGSYRAAQQPSPPPGPHPHDVKPVSSYSACRYLCNTRKMLVGKLAMLAPAIEIGPPSLAVLPSQEKTTSRLAQQGAARNERRADERHVLYR